MRTLDDEDILALVQSGSRKLDRQIRSRDWREAIAGIIAGVIIAPGAVRGPALARVGVWMVLAGLVFVMWRLYRARRIGGRGGDDPSLSVADALRAEGRRLDAQIELLESVWWWYVAPLSIGVILLTVGVRGASWFTLAYTVVVALVACGIVALNLRVVRRDLRPRRVELTALLAELGE
jgi:cobalamin synthase